VSDTIRIGEYECVERLGAGGQATTWLAEPAGGGERLLLKVFHVEVADDWKAAELFERAARVLESIDHPNIPAYHDHFEVESDGVVKLCLARDFVAGDSLQDRIDADGSMSEDEVVDLAIELLEVLRYLHAKTPPVVHRDIKPANVILGDDGRPYLVDFGAVQAEVLSETGGSTVVGTAGYVAPEQLMGRAEPSSDIYALGVTLVHLLTHTPPTELPSDGFELRYDDRLEASSGLKYVLGRMTRADIEEREASADGLLEKFRALKSGGDIVVRSSTLPVRVPRGSELQVVDENGAVVVQTPEEVLYWSSSRLQRWGSVGLFAFLAFVAFAFPFGCVVQQVALAMALGVAALGFVAVMWRYRRRLRFELRDHALRIQQPPFRTAPSQQHSEYSMAEYPDETPLDSPDVLISYDHLERAEVVRRPSWSTNRETWKLCLHAETAMGVPAGFYTGDDRRPMDGPLVAELNLTHGEYLWLAKLINQRLEQHRELS
jgi:serine/threonine protein kinase